MPLKLGDNDASELPRVLMYVPQFPYPIVGGLERQALRLSAALIAKGVTVLALSGKIEPDQPLRENVEGVEVVRRPWPRSKLLRYIFNPVDTFIVLFRIRNEFDVLHVHQNSLAGLYAILIGRLLGKPVLTKLPNVGDLGVPGIQSQAFGMLRIAALKKSAGIVAMTRESVSELDAIGYPEERVLLVSNGIEIRESIASSHRKKGPLRVVFVGRLNEQKQLPNLIGAWKKLKDEKPLDARLEIWGDGPDQPALKQLCRKLDVEDSILFQGYCESVREVLADADVFVLPSRIEGNSNSILEAMEAGLPIVATTVGGAEMQVGPEGAKLLCPPGDMNALAERLQLVLADSKLRIRTGAAMRCRVEKHFNINRIADIYIEAYRSLCGSVHPSLGSISNLPDGMNK